ncbi:MAG: dTDP-4-dehydrorhamnose 3,5-epimerase [Phycisphaerales bacterium]|nr:dTDP-4-dehydrorhamnose 3,5-epimerase [Phycisphaerales bacterium]
MNATELAIPGVFVLEPKVFGDERGFFFESFNANVFEQLTGRSTDFVQDNHSRSSRGVLRGLHFQLAPRAQAKLVRVVHGEIFDVAVDVRPESKTFGQWVSQSLSAENKKQMWIPEGFAHGFLTMSETAEVLYKTNGLYAPEFERCVLWNDTSIGIDWPTTEGLVISEKDRAGQALSDCQLV